MNDLVSVVVPIYNVERKLERCLNSLKNQTYNNIEILLINDGSPDNSEEICLKYIKNDKRFKYFKKKNGGLSSARNFGICNALGKYIYFIDSDDYCEKNLLEILIKDMTDDIQISSCGYYVDYPGESFQIKKNYKKIGRLEKKEFILNLDSEGMLNVVWNKLYRLDIIKKYNLKFELDMMPGEDLVFNCQYLKTINKGVCCNEILYHYMRENEETLVNKYDKNLIQKVDFFIISKEKLFESIDIEKNIFKESMSNTVISYAFSCLTNLYRKKMDYKNRLNEMKKIISLCRNKDYYCNTKLYDKNIKLFLRLISINKPKLMIFIYNILFFLRNNFKNIYYRYRKLLLKNDI